MLLKGRNMMHFPTQPEVSEGDDEDGKRRLVVVEEISMACSEFGFFQVVNQGIPLELMKEAVNVYRAFFDSSYEDKVKSGVPQPQGSLYSLLLGCFRSPDLSKEGNEHFLIISPDLGLNSYPKTLPKFQYICTFNNY